MKREASEIDALPGTGYPTPASSEGDSSTTSHLTSPSDAVKANITARYLEELSVTLMLAHNRITEPIEQQLLRAHMDPSFVMLDTSIHDCPIPSTSSLEDHMQNMVHFYKTHPSFEIKVENVTAQVDKDGDHAIIWMTEPGVSSQEERTFNRESVSRLYFRKRERDGKWIWYKHMSVRGSGDFF
jgi:hypothetical protein